MVSTRNLYESALTRSRVLRQGEIVCLIVDGGGAMVIATQDYVQAQKWAQSKVASGNLLSDRGRFLERIPALIARPGSLQATRGNQRQIEKLVRIMRQGGYDLSEWMLPPELKRLPVPQPQEKPPCAPAAEREVVPAAPEAPVSPLVRPRHTDSR